MLAAMGLLLLAGVVAAYFWNRWMDRRETRREVQRRMDAITKAFNEFAVALGEAMVPAIRSLTEALDQVAAALRKAGLLEGTSPTRPDGR